MAAWSWLCALLATAGCAGLMEQQRRNEADIGACDAGTDATACLRVGRLYRDAAENRVEPGEREIALTAFDRGCGGGVVEACSEGAAFFNPTASAWETKHPEVKTRMTAHACELGDDSLCLAIATGLPHGDPDRRALARKVCDRTVTRCVAAALIVYEADPALALTLARHACTRRAAPTCSEAAHMPFDNADLDALLAASCDLRTAADCYELGNREIEDPLRAASALDHYRLACKLDHADACVKVGQLRSK